MNRRRSLSIDKVLYNAVFAVIVLLTVLYVVLFTDFFFSDYREDLRSFSDNWKISEGQWVNLDKIDVSDFGGRIELSKPLPSSTTDADSLCFESSNVNLKVSLGDKEIYSFNSKENLTGMGYGHTFHEVGLSAVSAGKELTLVYESCGKTINKGSITGVYLGPAANYMHMNVIHRAVQFILTLSIIFFGVLIIIIYIMIPDKDEMPFDIGKLGEGSFLIGLWLLSGAGMLQLLLGNVYVWRILSCVTLILSGFPFISFFNSMTRTRRQIFEVLAFSITLLLEFSIILIRYIPRIDMMRSLGIYEGLMAVLFFITVLVILLDNYYHCKSHFIPVEYKSIYVGLFIVIISATAEFLLSYTHIGTGYLFGTVMRIGMLLFMNIVMYEFSKWWVKSQAIADRDRFVNNTLKFAAYSKNPDESVKLMLEYIGRETDAKRAYIYEDIGKGKMQNTYEWFAEGSDPMSKELSVLYSNKDIFKAEDVPKGTTEGHMLVYEPEEIRAISPGLYDRMKKYSIKTVAIGPLRTDKAMLGFWTVEDVQGEKLEELGAAMDVISYFFVQSINQRKEQERMLYYSYHDPLSGAQNRSALRQFTTERLDLTQPFGYLLCEIRGLREINNILGQDDGDRAVKETAQCLIEIFGDRNVFRLSGNEFAAFGFESDETFFDNDVEMARRKLESISCDAVVASVFCTNGTSNLNNVTGYVYNLLKKREN